jgi:anaerobic ribonucleoside-triphosphate reductase|tara:strand:+ start:481 stop:666 length:186 start_codon:yes stop_codon:yes gene_type:complete
MLVATFNIPTMGDHENEDKLFRLMHSIFEIVDAVANIKHSPTVLAKCEKNRKKQVQEAKAK